MLSLYHRLGLNIYATDRSVIRAVRDKMNPKARRDPAKREQRHYVYREVLRHHRDALKLAREFRL